VSGPSEQFARFAAIRNTFRPASVDAAVDAQERQAITDDFVRLFWDRRGLHDDCPAMDAMIRSVAETGKLPEYVNGDDWRVREIRDALMATTGGMG
jgi:hypothetical protein